MTCRFSRGGWQRCSSPAVSALPLPPLASTHPTGTCADVAPHAARLLAMKLINCPLFFLTTSSCFQCELSVSCPVAKIQCELTVPSSVSKKCICTHMQCAVMPIQITCSFIEFSHLRVLCSAWVAFSRRIPFRTAERARNIDIFASAHAVVDAGLPNPRGTTDTCTLSDWVSTVGLHQTR